jgi:hypothetical protein
MKKILYLICLVSFLSCAKKQVDGVVIVNVANYTKVVSEPTIYMKKGSNGSVQIPLSAYDLKVTGNASGQTVFQNLAPDTYYFYATAPSGSITMSGGYSINVIKDVAPNRREIRIHIE